VKPRIKLPLPVGIWIPILYEVRPLLHSSLVCPTHRDADHATRDKCRKRPHLRTACGRCGPITSLAPELRYFALETTGAESHSQWNGCSAQSLCVCVMLRPDCARVAIVEAMRAQCERYDRYARGSLTDATMRSSCEIGTSAV